MISESRLGAHQLNDVADCDVRRHIHFSAKTGETHMKRRCNHLECFIFFDDDCESSAMSIVL